MPRHWRTAIAAFLVSFTLATPVAGQDPTGAIEGVVTDGTSAVVGGVLIVITHIDTGAPREVRSGADGFYRVQPTTTIRAHLTLEPGQTVTLTHRLTVHAGPTSPNTIPILKIENRYESLSTHF